MAQAEQIPIERSGACSGNIDGVGVEPYKICARNSAAARVEEACAKLGGVITDKISTSNPWFACDSIGDMRQRCEGSAKGTCVR